MHYKHQLHLQFTFSTKSVGGVQNINEFFHMLIESSARMCVRGKLVGKGAYVRWRRAGKRYYPCRPRDVVLALLFINSLRYDNWVTVEY